MNRGWFVWAATWTAVLIIAAVAAAVQKTERLLVFAAAALMLTALLHSVLGERFLLQPLFRRRDLPRLLGDQRFFSQTLRFVWHVFSVAFVGLAAILVASSADAPPSTVPQIVAATAAVSAVLVAAISRGRHLSWVAFAAVALAAWIGS